MDAAVLSEVDGIIALGGEQEMHLRAFLSVDNMFLLDYVTNATLPTSEKPRAATWINCFDWFALTVLDRGLIQFPFLLKGSPLPSCSLLALCQTGSVKTNSTDLGNVPAGAQH